MENVLFGNNSVFGYVQSVNVQSHKCESLHDLVMINILKYWI